MDVPDFAVIGMYPKYVVTKVETGEAVGDCFVLRPDRDPAARYALMAYAWATPNASLMRDIFEWMEELGGEDIPDSRLDELQREVGAWADGIFPKSTPDSIVRHMREELDELAEAVGGSPGLGPDLLAVRRESADIALMLLHLASKFEFSLWGAMRMVFRRNQTERTFEGPDDPSAIARGYAKAISGQRP